MVIMDIMAGCKDYDEYIYENVSPELWKVAQREAKIAKSQGRDVLAWLKYWKEQHEPKPTVQYIDPAILDSRLLETDSGLHYENYHGWTTDDR